MNSTVLEAHNLTKKYKHSLVIDHINLRIEKGKIYGFIGQNGAGRTTFLRLTAGLSFPTDGTLELWGQRTEPVSRSSKKDGMSDRVSRSLSQPDSSSKILGAEASERHSRKICATQTVFE